MRFVFVMDTLDRVTHDKDTTFAFIQAAQARGHECLHCLMRDLYIDGGEAHALTHRVQVFDAAPWITLHKEGGPARTRLRDTARAAWGGAFLSPKRQKPCKFLQFYRASRALVSFKEWSSARWRRWPSDFLGAAGCLAAPLTDLRLTKQAAQSWQL